MLHVNGFLTSQIGYDLGDPKRALIRSHRRDYVPDGARFAVLPVAPDNTPAEPALVGDVHYWGETWNAHWWEIDFSAVEEAGEYVIVVSAPDGNALYRSESVTIGDNILWRETVEAIALDQMEARVRDARNGIGWKDCGAEWREANSHATTVIGLCELLSVGFQWLTAEQVARLRAQIIHGCDYLALLQDTATRIGAPDGALVHEIPNHMVLIPGDTAQAVVALAHAGRLLADTHPEKSQEYIRRAVRAMNYLILEAKPFGGLNFSALNHGAPPDFQVPDEFMTRDLAMMLWGCVELWAAGQTAYQRHAVRLAREVMARQVPESRAEDGLYGHFYTFAPRADARADFTEKANVHHHVGHDTGATFPHYIAPLLEMASRWATHPDVPLWRECVRRFAEGYLIPACKRNPFYLLPVGYFAGKGLMSFCGPWHGINTSYGFAAALAVACMSVSSDPALRQIAVGNLQWFCGLNAGITRKSFEGCVLWREEIPEGVALPYSQIHGVGRRWTGCWTGIRGSVPNGFDVNPQFQLVVEPDIAKDEPLLYTDEDWIPHGAGFLAGLTALRGLKRFER